MAARRVYRSQARELIYTTMTNVEGDCLRRGKVLSKRKIFSKVEDITGIGRSTLQRIQFEGDSGEGFSTPGKKKNKKKASVKLDNFDKDVIRRTVHDFYLRKENPTLDKLLVALRDSIDFEFGRTTLSFILHDLGFEFYKCDNRSVLLERTDVVCQRRRFLRNIRAARREGRDIIFLDETWLNQAHTLSRSWQSETCKGGLKAPIGKGRRLIILSAGSDCGFVPESHLIFTAKSTKGDYHNEMNSENFTKWFKEMLLPNIPQKTAIVLDNAPYHAMRVNREPTRSSTKKVMQDWLSTLGIPWQEEMLKEELFDLVQHHKREPVYLLQEIAKSRGDHELIFLPPYHCDLNPIELIWAQVKSYVARKNTTFKLADVEKLCRESLSLVTAENWKKACEHTQKLEDEYWAKDGLIETEVEKLMINANTGESDTSEDEEGVGMLHSGSSTDTSSETEAAEENLKKQIR